MNSDNQRTGIGNVYDGNGHPTTYVLSGFPTYSITYDPENRPLSIGTGWSTTYGADGLRSSKTGSGTTTYYLYDQGEPIIELNSSGTVTATNVYAPDGLVARNQPSVGWVMYAFDPQGNAAQRFSSSGTVYAWTDYWLYGTASSTGPGISDIFGFEARYGYILDRELGWLHYCQNRYYDNQSGRWLTRDPIGPSGGIDLYEYCDASPLSCIDPSGLETFVGDDRGYAHPAWLAPGNWRSRRGTKSQIIDIIIHTNDDSIGFWGHGGRGRIYLDPKDKEWLNPQDMENIANARKKLHKPKFNYFMVNMCNVMSDPNMVKNILKMSKEVDGYTGTCYGPSCFRQTWQNGSDPPFPTFPMRPRGGYIFAPY